MTKEQINFIKRADTFIVAKDGERKTFSDWATAATFYNNNVRTASRIELSAISGMVGMTIAYKYQTKGVWCYETTENNQGDN